MVSKAREDLPEPDTPVMTVNASWGMSTSMFLRLWVRTPRTMMFASAVGVDEFRVSERTFQDISGAEGALLANSRLSNTSTTNSRCLPIGAEWSYDGSPMRRTSAAKEIATSCRGHQFRCNFQNSMCLNCRN